jgi:GT2 family glycosyltransferase/2-polyprenyl-3-methyl-5-hydroxy-6-metoxy-1,4-benzoquinol methylase
MKAAQYYEYERTEVLEVVPQNAARILDVGCGSGWLGEQLKRRQGAVVCGIEVVREAAERAVPRLDRVWNSPVETALAEIPDGSFDCIVTADVLEHLVNPWDVLARLRDKLSPGGTVVSSIPNVGHWDIIQDLLEGNWRYTAEGLLDRTHLRFFTKRSIYELFWTAGLTIRQVTTTRRGHPLPPALPAALRDAGLRMSEKFEDGQVFQYLVVAERQAPPTIWPRVGIVILNDNGDPATEQCLESVQGLAYAPFDVVVVDGGVAVRPIGTRGEQLPRIERPGIRGHPCFGQSVNLGIQHFLHRDAQYVLVLRGGMVLHRDSLRHLMETASITPEAGVWGPRICYGAQPDTTWATGFKWNSVRLKFERQGEGEPVGEDDIVQIADTLTDCAMLLRRDAIERVGMLAPEYSSSWAAIDFCTRAADQGFRSVVVPGAHISCNRASMGTEPNAAQEYLATRDRLVWARRHLPHRHVRAIWRQELLEVWRRLPAMPKTRGIRQCYWWARQVACDCRRPLVRLKLRALLDYLLKSPGDNPSAINELAGEIRPS